MGNLLNGTISFAEKRRRDMQKIRALAQFSKNKSIPPTPEPPEPTRELPQEEPIVTEATEG